MTLRDADVQVLTHLDLRSIATKALAVRGERVELAGDLARRRSEVRLVGVLRYEAQRLLLTRAADHDRNAPDGRRLIDRVLHVVVLAIETRAFVAQHADDDLQRLFEFLEPVGEGPELEAERLMLELEPACTDAELGATAGRNVERGDDLREQGRVAVGVAGHQRTEAHVLGLARQGA